MRVGRRDGVVVMVGLLASVIQAAAWLGFVNGLDGLLLGLGWRP
jgi:hypothetical protein